MQNTNTKAPEKIAGQKKKPNTFHAVDTLKDMILSNQLQAGSNHLEAELASLLGMSRTPVREATLILEAQGLVSVIPRHGVKILSISPTDMTEIYQVLTELECLSAELAATKNHPDEEFLVAETAIRDMENALENEDLEAWAVADDKFHSELVRLGENQRVINIFDMYTDQVKRARMLTLRLRPIPTKSNEDHRKVLEAIRSGQSEVAVKVHKEHRIQAGQMLVNLLEKFGLSNL
jgi:DNA-binding GntR family transcriptional regulator